MKQIFQYLDSGETKIIELPPPRLKKGEVLIRSKFSLISSGTERMLVNFGKSNLILKAKNQPEKVSEVIAKEALYKASAKLPIKCKFIKRI